MHRLREAMLVDDPPEYYSPPQGVLAYTPRVRLDLDDGTCVVGARAVLTTDPRETLRIHANPRWYERAMLTYFASRYEATHYAVHTHTDALPPSIGEAYYVDDDGVMSGRVAYADYGGDAQRESKGSHK